MNRLTLPLAAFVLATGCDPHDATGPTRAPIPPVSFGSASAVVPSFTVNTTNDLDDGACDATHCSLREALDDANAATGLDIIHFNISGATPHTVQPLSALPVITDPVIIDGTTQPGFSGKPVIELDGSKTSAGTVGLRITGGNSTVRGLVINRFMGRNPYGDAIVLSGQGGNVVEGNFIGTDVTGTKALTNANQVESGKPETFPGRGIFVDNSSNNTIGGTTASDRNVISGNYQGIQIWGAGATGNLVQGNYVGTDVTGTVALGNGARIDYYGKELYKRHVGVGVFATNNTIGGLVAGSRNIISGNGWGVSIGCGNNNVVQGNYIGTDVNGTTALVNEEAGVYISAIGSSCITTGNLIGGTTPGARNVISGNGYGVEINSTDDANVSGTLVQGNYIGTNATGTAPLPNAYGVDIYGKDATNVTVGGTTAGARNVISGNTEFGVRIINGRKNQVLGNYIGTNAAGNTALANKTGVELTREPGSSAHARENTIGGTAAGARNVISGNTKYGIYLGGAEANKIQGNYIGTNAAGTAALKNGSGVVLLTTGTFGLTLTTKDNMIGGTSPGARNVISGNTKYGIYLDGAETNKILGNNIGTNAAGTAALGNGVDGITVVDGTDNVVGGTTAGAANLISGNTRVGVLLSGSKATGNKVQGNYIGTDVTGTSAVGNGKSGVRIDQGSDNTIGGTASNAGNVIAFNSSAGAAVSTGTGNAILSNVFFSNTGLGIDLGVVPGTTDPNGVTPNDAGDSDTGPNGLQNFPVLSSFGSTGGSLVVQGTLNSTANATFRVELFSNTACDPSGYGEGGTFLASTSVTTDGSGNATLAIGVPGSVSRGEYLTATATDGSSNTSELSKCIVVPNRPPVGDPNGPYSGVEGSPVNFDATGSSDPDGDPLTYTWDFGDGNTGTGATPSHTYADNGTFDVNLEASDPDGLTGTDVTTAMITNVPPTVGPITAPTEPVAVGTVVTASAEFTDPGTGDTHTAACDWGNGVSTVGTVSEIAGSGSVACGYSYPAPGSYTIQITVTDDDGGVGSQSYASVVVFLPVTIDIKPGSDPNSINLGSKGTAPVAILSTPGFDATTVDPVSVTLADASVRVKGNGTPIASEEDVDGDGLLDLVVHVFTSGLELTQGDIVAVLWGETYDGWLVRGSDSVRIVP